MGLSVGDLVVGLEVLGLTVGAVGCAEGADWGAKDGTAVGGLEGSLDGCKVGWPEGRTLG